MTKAKLDWALEMLGRNRPVFPLYSTHPDGTCTCVNSKECASPGKHPIPHNGVKAATKDIKQIRKWWAENPDANIGTPGGDGILLIDLDLKTAPDGTAINGINVFAEKMGIDPWDIPDQSFAVRTPRGGYHLYYATNEEFANGVGRLTGVDVRAEGGYVVAPGSVIGDRTYEIVSENPLREFAKLPMGVKAMLRPPKEKDTKTNTLMQIDHPVAIQRARDMLNQRVPAILGQGGDEHTYVTCNLIMDMAVSPEKALALMLEKGGWNSRCEPPWLPSELTTKMENAFRYRKERLGSKGGSEIDSFLDQHGEDSELGEEISDDPFHKYRPLTYPAEKMRTIKLEYDMIAPGWIPANGLVCVLAQRSMGKTTFMMDLCCRLASDMDWTQNIELEKGWSIFWISGEDTEGVIVRFKAWEKTYGKIEDTERFITLNMPIPITDGAEVDNFAKYVQEMKGNKKKIIFVLDTWQRMTSEAESQSADKDMQLAIHNVEALARQFGAPCLIAFHPPKNNTYTIMGSSVIENSSQVIIRIEDAGKGTRKAEVVRIKSKGYGNSMYFDLKEVEYGDWDKFGKPCTSVIAKVTTDSFTPRTFDTPLSAADSAKVKLLHHIMQQANMLNTEFNEYPMSLIKAVQVMCAIPALAVNTTDPDLKELAIEFKNELDDSNFTPTPKDLSFAATATSGQIKGWSSTTTYQRLQSFMRDTSRKLPFAIPGLTNVGLYAEKASEARKAPVYLKTVDVVMENGGTPEADPSKEDGDDENGS